MRGEERVLDSSATAKDELWVVTATPGTAMGLDFQGLHNLDTKHRTRKFPTITIHPDNPPSNGFATALHNVTDVDGDSVSLTYEWTVDGKVIAGETGNSLDGRLYFTRDQELVVKAIPNDGTTDGLPKASDPAIVGNAPPTPPPFMSIRSVLKSA